ncbi:uncharacterized protein N7483_011111 [Penicillium malachiteum]|uniref:uncharacterized protein n=1 Tax=Penicillium malachiteum TaxID=1324776 RepID=UPI0025466339|nr:uncharacterized protein N7483_011111 [Penicillium malachiteum]KAJ5713930.1 hypothetical protein N7483_011111 [Penicillium malachiteum]
MLISTKDLLAKAKDLILLGKEIFLLGREILLLGTEILAIARDQLWEEGRCTQWAQSKQGRPQWAYSQWIHLKDITGQDTETLINPS